MCGAIQKTSRKIAQIRWREIIGNLNQQNGKGKKKINRVVRIEVCNRVGAEGWRSSKVHSRTVLQTTVYRPLDDALLGHSIKRQIPENGYITRTLLRSFFLFFPVVKLMMLAIFVLVLQVPQGNKQGVGSERVS